MQTLDLSVFVKEKVVLVIGLGYVGLAVAVAAAEAGHKVVGVDLDQNKINSLNEFTSYIEDVTDEQLRLAVSNFKAIHGDDIAQLKGKVELCVIAVPTPVIDAVPDLSYVASAGKLVGSVMVGGETVILESTTYPGTTEGLLADAIAEANGLRPSIDYKLGYSPERIDPGNKVQTLKTTPKIVSGVDADSLASVQAFYDTFIDTTVAVSSTKVAELTKVWENSYAAAEISKAGSLAMVCNKLGIDVYEVLEAGFTKGHSMGDRIWTPNIGYGGHCLPEDPLYLNWLMKAKFGESVPFIELADKVNSDMPNYIVSRAQDILNDDELAMKGSKILLLGLSYKPNTADRRKSKAVELLGKLKEKGAQVTVSDPFLFGEFNGTAVDNDLVGLENYDLVILATPHAAFDLGKVASVAKKVFDPSHTIPAADNVVFL